MDIFFLIFLVFLSALFSSSETALFSLRESQVRLMQKKRAVNADLVAKLKKDPQRLLITLLIGNNIANIAIASLATVLAISEFGTIGAGIAAGITTVVVLLLGEIIPKSLAFTYKERVSRFVIYPVYFCYILFFPATSLFVHLEKWWTKKTKFEPRSVISEEEIRIMAELGLEHGEIDRHEVAMIESVFSFDDTHAGEVMTIKSKIESLNGEVPVEQIAHHVSQSGFSRYPVYHGNQNEFIGYVHANDILRVLNSDSRDQELLNFIRPLGKIDETVNTREIFRIMTRERSHLYLVHRKNFEKEIVGLVTMEDVLEEIMGEIEDEGDKRAQHKKL